MPDLGRHDWIEAQLRNVPIPADLLARLSASGPASAEADSRLDAALRDVSVPPLLESRLRRIARRREPIPLWRQVSLAASLFFMLGLGAAGYFGLLVGMVGPGESKVAQGVVPVQDANVLKSRVATPAPVLPTEAVAAQAAPKQSGASQANNLVNSTLAHNKNADNKNPADSKRNVGSTGPAPSATADNFPLPTYENMVTASSLVKQAVAAKRREQSALGANGALDRLPDLDAFDGSLARGISPPRVPGYDLMFQLKHGEHPFTSPAAHASLATSRIPFSFRTASYDLASRSLRAGQLPPADEVRVEDFLAAQDYILPPAPAGGLMLYAAGSVSPLGSEGLHLLDLTVQAAAQNPRAHAPLRLIVAIDTSSQMRGGARWDAVQRALTKLTRAMNDGDRLTLIGCAEQSRVLAYNTTRHELQTWLESDALPAPTGSANVALAIESASTAARAGQSRAATRVVVITGDHNDFDETELAKSTQALSELAHGGISWQVVRVAMSEATAQWSELARAARGKVTPALSAAEIYDVLLENLAGRSTTVAGGATLKLTFNPQVVTGYRLLGHESATITGPSADPLTIDLHADQTATGLYELWIKPGGDALVATAELTWNDPKAGQPRRIVRPLSHAQVNGSFSNAPPWFQQGVIAAKLAEVLRGSYFAPTSHPLGQILDLSRQVDPRVAEQPQFQHLVGLLKQAEKLR